MSAGRPLRLGVHLFSLTGIKGENCFRNFTNRKMAEPKNIQEVETPCFLVDIDIVNDNARRMRERCEKVGVNLRPHMKTHKTT